MHVTNFAGDVIRVWEDHERTRTMATLAAVASNITFKDDEDTL